MSATWKLAREVLNEEIARIGFWDEHEGWYAFKGENKDKEFVDMLTPIYEATAERTGISAERLREVLYPRSTLFNARAQVLYGGRGPRPS